MGPTLETQFGRSRIEQKNNDKNHHVTDRNENARKKQNENGVS